MFGCCSGRDGMSGSFELLGSAMVIGEQVWPVEHLVRYIAKIRLGCWREHNKGERFRPRRPWTCAYSCSCFRSDTVVVYYKRAVIESGLRTLSAPMFGIYHHCESRTAAPRRFDGPQLSALALRNTRPQLDQLLFVYLGGVERPR